MDKISVKFVCRNYISSFTWGNKYVYLFIIYIYLFNASRLPDACNEEKNNILLGSRLKVENMRRFICLQSRLFSMCLISTKLLRQILEVSCSPWIFNPRSGIVKVNIISQFHSLSLLSSSPFQVVPVYRFRLFLSICYQGR